MVSQGTAVHFNCPNCNALYRLIKAEAGPETLDGEISCRVCGAPLPGRDGSFVLKYFLLRKAARPDLRDGQAPSGQSRLRLPAVDRLADTSARHCSAAVTVWWDHFTQWELSRMNTHTPGIDADRERLEVARTLYKAVVAQYPDRLITLCDGAGWVLASSQRPEQDAAENAS
jgi:hypothetical protein